MTAMEVVAAAAATSSGQSSAGQGFGGGGRAKGDQYDRRARIGKGAFGDVYLCYPRGASAGTKTAYVLKSIKLARQNEWQRAATHREIKLMAALQHPFIVPFIDHWMDNNHTVNVVLGYCEQGDLSVVLAKRQGKLIDEHQLKAWLAQLLLALHYLQEQHVLHRDVKTSNIFLHAEGYVQLGDFGLASVRDGQDEASQHDQSLVGTPHFMSPELLSQKGYGHETDVWSLGCVMYELSAQKPAFTAFNLNGLVDKIKRRGMPPLPPSYSAEWCSIIRSMLCKDPSKRPTPAELLATPCMQRATSDAQRLAHALESELLLSTAGTGSIQHQRHDVHTTPDQGRGVATHTDARGGEEGVGTAAGRPRATDAAAPPPARPAKPPTAQQPVGASRDGPARAAGRPTAQTKVRAAAGRTAVGSAGDAGTLLQVAKRRAAAMGGKAGQPAGKGTAAAGAKPAGGQPGGTVGLPRAAARSRPASAATTVTPPTAVAAAAAAAARRPRPGSAQPGAAAAGTGGRVGSGKPATAPAATAASDAARPRTAAASVPAPAPGRRRDSSASGAGAASSTTAAARAPASAPAAQARQPSGPGMAVVADAAQRQANGTRLTHLLASLSEAPRPAQHDAARPASVEAISAGDGAPAAGVCESPRDLGGDSAAQKRLSHRPSSANVGQVHDDSKSPFVPSAASQAAPRAGGERSRRVSDEQGGSHAALPWRPSGARSFVGPPSSRGSTSPPPLAHSTPVTGSPQPSETGLQPTFIQDKPSQSVIAPLSAIPPRLLRQTLSAPTDRGATSPAMSAASWTEWGTPSGLLAESTGMLPTAPSLPEPMCDSFISRTPSGSTNAIGTLPNSAENLSAFGQQQHHPLPPPMQPFGPSNPSPFTAVALATAEAKALGQSAMAASNGGRGPQRRGRTPGPAYDSLFLPHGFNGGHHHTGNADREAAAAFGMQAAALASPDLSPVTNRASDGFDRLTPPGRDGMRDSYSDVSEDLGAVALRPMELDAGPVVAGGLSAPSGPGTAGMYMYANAMFGMPRQSADGDPSGSMPPSEGGQDLAQQRSSSSGGGAGPLGRPPSGSRITITPIVAAEQAPASIGVWAQGLTHGTEASLSHAASNGIAPSSGGGQQGPGSASESSQLSLSPSMQLGAGLGSGPGSSTPRLRMSPPGSALAVVAPPPAPAAASRPPGPSSAAAAGRYGDRAGRARVAAIVQACAASQSAPVTSQLPGAGEGGGGSSSSHAGANGRVDTGGEAQRAAVAVRPVVTLKPGTPLPLATRVQQLEQCLQRAQSLFAEGRLSELGKILGVP